MAVGYSNGANIAGSILLLRPETLGTALLFRAMVPLVPEKLPDLSSKRVWISAGNQDSIITTPEAERIAGLLRSAGADVTLRFLNAGHGLIADDLEGARTWVANLEQSA